MLKVSASLILILWSAVAARAMEDGPELDVRSIPIADWIEAGEKSEIPWRVEVRRPLLRMDQRLEVFYSSIVSGKQLQQSGTEHDLFLINRISDPDGEWLTPFTILHQQLDQELPKSGEVHFNVRVLVQPGDYVLWVVLYDRHTGRHSVAKRRVQVREIGKDPLPYAYMSLPLVEFPKIVALGNMTLEEVTTELNLPVENKHPLDVHIISTLSPPEQWSTRARLVQRHEDNLKGALDTFSQIELEDGSVSMTGLDLLRREIVFEQKDLRRLDWINLHAGFEKAGSAAISADALAKSKENGAFFKDFLNQQLAEEDRPENPLRVFIVVSGSLMFENGSNLTPLQVDGDCHCRVYHIRFRLSPNDVFDQLQKLIKPLKPKTFNILTAIDLRKAVADIIQELEGL